jgi:hypothetical protein
VEWISYLVPPITSNVTLGFFITSLVLFPHEQ